jgi:hypothetical protein
MLYLKNLSTNLSMVLIKNDVNRFEVPRSAIGIPTWVRYEHYLNLAPRSWNISCRQQARKSLAGKEKEPPVPLVVEPERSRSYLDFI